MHTGQEKGLIILLGPPNAGKTTLFNWLTGSRFKTVNYPGSTVECYVGSTHSRYGEPVTVVDTPGVYSLLAKSPDEEITSQALYGLRFSGQLKGVVVCVDATQLDRHLYLVSQVRASGVPFVVAVTMSDLANKAGHSIRLAELGAELGVPVVGIDGLLGGGADTLVERMRAMVERPETVSPKMLSGWDRPRILREMSEATRVAQLVSQAKVAELSRHSRRVTERLDRILLHPLGGIVGFTLIMLLLFSAIFWAADPLMAGIDSFFAWLGDSLHRGLGEGLWVDFLADGLVASFGALWVFVPQIFILFLGLSLLEDSGYLARAATIVDRPLSLLGLSGRSFVPLLSGYACAVPAILAARTIRSARERWIAVFVIPLMSCSARLPVYALLLTFLFPAGPAWKPGLVLALIYLISLLLGGLAASILNRLVKIKSDSRFMMELPIYRRPKMRVVFKSAMMRTRHFVMRAGPVIVSLALILWLATNFPRPEGAVTSSQKVSQSYAGQVGQWIEPVFKPMGVDWRVGVGLLSAFAAREVFVSAMALVFDVASSDQSPDSLKASLLEKMSSATVDGHPLFTLSSILGLIAFFMIALQCSSTTAIAKAEMHSWRFAMVQLVSLNVIAYVVAVGLVQGLRACGFS